MGGSRITLPSPSVIHVNESADDAFVGSFRHSSLSEAEDGFEYEEGTMSIRDDGKEADE